MLEKPGKLELRTRTQPPLEPPAEEVRSAIAALTFLEDVAHVGTIQSLRAWFRNDVGRACASGPWTRVREPGHRSLKLDEETEARELRSLLVSTRLHVVVLVRGLVRDPIDTSFLEALVHQGLVRRTGEAGDARWMASVGDERSLSELVLALLGADVLARREVYERRLCVCRACGRLSFEPTITGREGCLEHRAASR